MHHLILYRVLHCVGDLAGRNCVAKKRVNGRMVVVIEESMYPRRRVGPVGKVEKGSVGSRRPAHCVVAVILFRTKIIM